MNNNHSNAPLIAWSDLAAMSDTELNNHLEKKRKQIERKLARLSRIPPGRSSILLLQIANHLM